MNDHQKPYHSYPFRHRLISWIGDLDVKGVRRLASALPRWIMPDPKKQGEIILNTIHGVHFHINPSVDNGVELSLFLTGTYEKGILNFIENHYSGRGSFVDVGANIGLMSIFTAKKFPQAKIHAVEAHPETTQILERNRIANTANNVEVHSIALGNEHGEVTLYDNWQVNRGGASLVVKTADSKGYQVSMHRFDDLDFGEPEMIKIDVEGVELEVLKGAENCLRTHHPVLIVEISNERENQHASSKEIVEYIRSLDYRIFKLKGGKERKSRLVEIHSMEDVPAHDNIICLTGN